jgi:hypothetical protein
MNATETTTEATDIARKRRRTPSYVTVTEAGVLAGMSAASIYKHIRLGAELGQERVGDVWIINRRQFRAWIAAYEASGKRLPQRANHRRGK